MVPVLSSWLAFTPISTKDQEHPPPNPPALLPTLLFTSPGFLGWGRGACFCSRWLTQETSKGEVGTRTPDPNLVMV